MTCNLSSYQILSNSILFHWLLFISIPPSTPCISFVISFCWCWMWYILEVFARSLAVYSIYVPFACCLFYCVFAFSRYSLFSLMRGILLLRNCIRCSVRFFPSSSTHSLLFHYKGTSTQADGETKQIATIVYISLLLLFLLAFTVVKLPCNLITLMIWTNDGTRGISCYQL